MADHLDDPISNKQKTYDGAKNNRRTSWFAHKKQSHGTEDQGNCYVTISGYLQHFQRIHFLLLLSYMVITPSGDIILSLDLVYLKKKKIKTDKKRIMSKNKHNPL